MIQSATRRSSAPAAGRRLPVDPWLVSAALLALLPILAIVRPGVPNTADGQVHLLRTLEVVRLLRAGILYPRWAPDFYLGYGYPFFNFYAPGAHVLAALLALAGLGIVRGVVALEVLALLLYPTGAYLAARSVLPEGPARGPAALVGAALYLYAPLRCRELFIQGNLSQLLALALLPWCAWLVTQAARRAAPRTAIPAGLALAALVYAHHPSAFLAYPSLAVYGLVVAFVATRSNHKAGQAPSLTPEAVADGPDACALVPRLLTLTGAFALGIALSAPYWLPSLLEMRDVNLGAISAGMFNARLNLLPLREILALPAVLDGAALNPPMPNSLGLAQLLLAAPGPVAALWWIVSGRPMPSIARPDILLHRESGSTWQARQAGWLALTAVGLMVASIALITPLAGPLWDALPLARTIAFPWRLYGPALLWAALLGGAGMYLVPARFRTAALLASMVLIPLGIAPYLFPRPFARTSDPTVADIARYEMSGGARGTASANEYLPRWVSDDNPPATLAQSYLAGRQPDRLDTAALPAGSRVELIEDTLLSDRFRVVLTAPGALSIRRFYFPGWGALVDGVGVPVGQEKTYGLITVPVPAGEHEVIVRFGTTVPRVLGAFVALLGVLAAVWVAWRPRPVRAAAAVAQPVTGYGLALAAGLVIVALAVAKEWWIAPHTTWFRYSSPVTSPAGMQHAVHARFSNGMELLGYDLSDGEATQGQTLDVRLYWQASAADIPDVRPFLHLDAPTGDTNWANQTKINAGDKPTSSWPAGFFVVDDYQLDVPAETPAVVANLRTGLRGADGHLVTLVAGGDQAILGPVRIRERTPLQPGSLPGNDTPYSFGGSVRLVGHAVALPPGSVDVLLYWQAAVPVSADYTVFVHVYDRRGREIAQDDRTPVNGWYPSSRWLPQQVVSDFRSIKIPAGIDTDGVKVAVGLYTMADGRRAAATDAKGIRQIDDQIWIEPE